jgi:hypothetical protein
MNYIEIIGYSGTLAVIVAFMFDGLKLRVINSIGCILFIIYGLLNRVDIPILTTNAVILLINLRFILWKKKEN